MKTEHRLQAVIHTVNSLNRLQNDAIERSNNSSQFQYQVFSIHFHQFQHHHCQNDEKHLWCYFQSFQDQAIHRLRHVEGEEMIWRTKAEG